MTSVLNVDAIAAKNGTSPVTLTKQSAAKAWAKVTYSGGVPSSADSINISSYNDDGTGTYDANFTNSMSSSDYSASGMATKETRVITFNTFDSTFLELRVYDLVVGISSLSDSSSTFAIHGDLA